MALVKVRYKGISDVRIISKKDAAGKGVKVDKDMVWDRANLWSIVVDGMSEQMEQMFIDEGTFTVEEMTAAQGKKEKVIIKATKSDDTGATVVDGTTGQKSTKGSGT